MSEAEIVTESPRPTGSKTPIDLPLKRAMPLPLMVTFAVLSAVVLVAVTVLLIKPSAFQPVPLTERRPPPGPSVSHEAGRIAPAPTPAVKPTLPPPCEAFAQTRLVMSGHGVMRVRDALDRLCRLSGGGVGPELATAIQGVGQASIRFAQFEISGLESTLEGRTIWLNLRFARSGTPVEQLLPSLIHEGYHLGSGTAHPTAAQELAARRAELDVCKEVIARSDWPRWCNDAEDLLALPEREALDALRVVGYAAR